MIQYDWLGLHRSNFASHGCYFASPQAGDLRRGDETGIRALRFAISPNAGFLCLRILRTQCSTSKWPRWSASMIPLNLPGSSSSSCKDASSQPGTRCRDQAANEMNCPARTIHARFTWHCPNPHEASPQDAGPFPSTKPRHLVPGWDDLSRWDRNARWSASELEGIILARPVVKIEVVC